MRRSILLYLAFILVVLTFNCKKDTTDNSDNPTTPNNPPGSNPDSTLIKKVYVIDSTKLVLTSDSILLSAGRFEYTFTGTAPQFKAKDVIVGVTNGGYIRRISSINMQSNRVTLETTQGTMEDIFTNAHFSFSTGVDSLHGGKMQSESDFDLSGMMLYEDANSTFKISKGLITIGGDWNFDFDYKDSKLNSFEMICRNAILKGDLELNVKTNNSVNTPEKLVTLKRASKYFILWIGQVPMVVYMEIELQGKVSASAGAGTETTFHVITDNSLDVGMEYKNGQWQKTFNKNVLTNISVPRFQQDFNAELRLALIPYISFPVLRNSRALCFLRAAGTC